MKQNRKMRKMEKKLDSIRAVLQVNICDNFQRSDYHHRAKKKTPKRNQKYNRRKIKISCITIRINFDGFQFNNYFFSLFNFAV